MGVEKHHSLWGLLGVCRLPIRRVLKILLADFTISASTSVSYNTGVESSQPSLTASTLHKVSHRWVLKSGYAAEAR
jgi:hypothetical protein